MATKRRKQTQLLIEYSNGSTISMYLLGFRAGFKNYKPTHMTSYEYMKGYKLGQVRRDTCVGD